MNRMNQEQSLQIVHSPGSNRFRPGPCDVDQRLHVPAFLLVLAFAAVTIGCSDGRPKRVAVSGKVTIDGEPLVQGTVKFVPENARPSAGTVDENGRFVLTCYDGNDGAVPGVHRVQVSANEIISDSKIRWFAPRKYADFRTSEITVEIDEPTDSIVIELAWDGQKGPYVETR